MDMKRIAAMMAMLLVAGPAAAQGRGDGQGGGQSRGMPMFGSGQDVERGRGGARPDDARRERRDRAEERIRERRERRDGDAGERGRDAGEDIYRRSNNYRRW